MAGEVGVGAAAAILRFHDDVVPVADPAHLAGIVDAMVEAADVLTGVSSPASSPTREPR